MEIQEASGKRWGLALELLRSGESEVVYRGVSLHRSVSGPRADGLVHISILTSGVLPIASARQEREIREGREALNDLIASDARLPKLLAEFGTTWSYVLDYGKGGVTLAEIPDA